MRCASRRFRSLALAVPAVLLVPAAAQAGPALTLTQMPVTIDVSMKVTVDENYQSITTCPGGSGKDVGEDGSVSYTFDWESVKPTKTTASLTNGEGGTGYSLGKKGLAKEKGKPGVWRSQTTDCAGQKQPAAGIEEPACKSIAGRVKAALALEPADDSADLTPLTKPGVITVARAGGGQQNRSCMRLIQNTVPAANAPIDFGVGAAAAGASTTFAIKVPNLGGELDKLIAGRKARFSHRFSLSGACYAFTSEVKAVKFAATGSSGNVGPVLGFPYNETCAIHGDGVVIVTRAGKVRRAKY